MAKTYKEKLRDAHKDLVELREIGNKILSDTVDNNYVQLETLVSLEKAMNTPASHWTHEFDKSK